jgi:hypothetical protein
MEPEWFKMKTLAKYWDMSERTTRKQLKHGLRYSRLPSGSIRVKRQWADEYLESHIVSDETSIDIDQCVDDIVADLRR